ncbi:MAG: PAS domain S-box protein [Candidatus Hodarchaeales archaeon]|jgi:PAS domain S-box-containing protein
MMVLNGILQREDIPIDVKRILERCLSEGKLKEIDEKKDWQQLYHKSEERFNDYLSLFPTIVFELDSKLEFTFLSQYGTQFMGYTHDDLSKGISLFDFFIDNDRRRLNHNIKKILDGEDVDTQEYTALRKDKTTFPSFIFIKSIFPDQKIIGLRGIIHDLSEQKELKQAKQRLNAQRKKLTETLSFELRTPLTNIKGSVDILKNRADKLNEDQINQCVDFIDKNVTRLVYLANEVFKE